MRLLLIVLALLSSLPVAATEYAVVIASRSGLEGLEAKVIREVFLKKRRFADKLRLLPINITGETPARRAFEETVLGMNREELNRYWVANHFQGVSPPGTQASFNALKKIVLRVEGAITYLPISMVDEELKVIYEF